MFLLRLFLICVFSPFYKNARFENTSLINEAFKFKVYLKHAKFESVRFSVLCKTSVEVTLYIPTRSTKTDQICFTTSVSVREKIFSFFTKLLEERKLIKSYLYA